MPGRVFHILIYANTNIPDNCFKFYYQLEINELLDENEDTFKKNRLDRYMDRSDKVSKWKICFTEFFMLCRIP